MKAFIKEGLRSLILRVLRVPHEPSPPLGAPGSLRVFRAGRNFWRLSLAKWGLKQTMAVFGLVVSIYFISQARGHEEQRNAPEGVVIERTFPRLPLPGSALEMIDGLARKVPAELLPWLVVGEALAVVGFLIQLPFTLLTARLDFSFRWYMVTDRSLRIRSGLVRVQEATMSFANVQQVTVSQGPLERWLGLADVRVESAGGGGDGAHAEKQGDGMHRGVFEGVENAAEIRDLILERLRYFREAGLGDPEEVKSAIRADAALADGPGAITGGGEAAGAARELLAEARALRASWRAE